jgi:hypothetical protein
MNKEACFEIPAASKFIQLDDVVVSILKHYKLKNESLWIGLQSGDQRLVKGTDKTYKFTKEEMTANETSGELPEFELSLDVMWNQASPINAKSKCYAMLTYARTVYVRCC